MSFIHKKGKVESEQAVVKSGVTIVRGDALEADTGEVKLATLATQVENFAGFAGEAGTAGETITIDRPQNRNTQFEVEVTGGTVVKFGYYDLSDENTLDGSGVGSVEQFRVVKVLSATKAIVEVGTRGGNLGSADIADDSITSAKIADDAVSLEHLDAAITPSHIVVYAGEVTTAGGDAAESATVTGVLATDLVVGSIHTEGATPVTLDQIVCATDAVNSTWSADPSTDHVYTYIVYRAAA